MLPPLTLACCPPFFQAGAHALKSGRGKAKKGKQVVASMQSETQSALVASLASTREAVVSALDALLGELGPLGDRLTAQGGGRLATEVGACMATVAGLTAAQVAQSWMWQPGSTFSAEGCLGQVVHAQQQVVTRLRAQLKHLKAVL